MHIAGPKIYQMKRHINTINTIADSAQTEYCPTFLLSVCPFVTGVTSHISHIYKGINAMLIIRDPSTPIYDSLSDVGEIRVYQRADFQSGSRVLKKVF